MSRATLKDRDDKPPKISNESSKPNGVSGSSEKIDGLAIQMKSANLCEPTPQRSSAMPAGQTEKILARHLQETISSKADLYCYRIVLPGSGKAKEKGGEPHTAALHSLVNSRFPRGQCCIWTDYHKYLVSTCGASESAKPDGGSVANLDFIKSVKGIHILQFLNSAKLPDDARSKEAVLSVFEILRMRNEEPNNSGDTEEKSFTTLDIQSRHSCQSTARALEAVVDEFKPLDADNLRTLELYLKGRRLQLRESKGTGNVVLSLARQDEIGTRKVSQPPRVSKFGANADEVQFYLKSKKTYYTVAKYYKEIKGQILKRPDLPVVNIGTRRKPTFIPPEHYSLLQPQKTATSEFTFSDIGDVSQATDARSLIRNCTTKPTFRFPGLKMLPEMSQSNFSIGITSRSMLASHRPLEGPYIAYFGGKPLSTVYGLWETKSLKVDLKSGELRKLAVLRIGSPTLTMENTFSRLQNRLSELGVSDYKNLSITPVDMQHDLSNEKVKRELHKHLTEIAKTRPNAVLVILPHKQQIFYDYVKCECDTVLGIHNICVVAPQFFDEKKKSCFLQIGLKLNLKAGGTNQTLQQPKFKPVNLQTTMIVGFDTLNPSPKAHEGARSIAAVVASTEGSLSQWPARVKVIGDRPAHQELAYLLKQQLDTWRDKPQGHLTNIIIFRNGLTVKDEQACKDEMSSMEAACKDIGGQKGRPNLTYVIVNKDHNAQLRTQSSFNQNPGDQTVPATSILIRTRDAGKDEPWEFVLQGHKPLSKKESESDSIPSSEVPAKYATLPVRYSVLKDDVFSPAKTRQELENLTHAMYYLSGCGISSINDTLPIYYVGLLCKRMQSYLRPWYRPANRKDPSLGVMSQKTIQANQKIENDMFYV